MVLNLNVNLFAFPPSYCFRSLSMALGLFSHIVH